MNPAIDVESMAQQLLAVLGNEGEVEDFLQQHVPLARGSREQRVAEWLLGCGYSHTIESALVEPLGNMETRRLLASAGIADVPARVPCRIKKWLELHKVPLVNPVPGAQIYRLDLDVLRTQVADRWDDASAAAEMCVRVRRKLELSVKEVVAYQWGLLFLADAGCLELLQSHLEKHRKDYKNEIFANSADDFLESVANSRLTAHSLLMLLRKCVSLAESRSSLHDTLSVMTGGKWALTAKDIDAIRAFFAVIHPDTHDTPCDRRPSIEAVQECWDGLNEVHDVWRAKGIFPRIIQRKELVENEWGRVVRVFDLTEWQGAHFDEELPELQLHCGGASPPVELLDRPPRPLYAYLANNPISVNFKVRPRPERLCEEMGKL
jgi:hypothetical protein